MALYKAKVCPKCTTSMLMWDNEDNCLNCYACGYRPPTQPSAWAMKQYPTDKVYKSGSKAPPTRMYE